MLEASPSAPNQPHRMDQPPRNNPSLASGAESGGAGSASIAVRAAWLVLPLAATALLYQASRYNYLLFHSLVELASVTIAIGVFLIFWNARRFVENGYFLFLGVSLAFVSIFEILHTLSYTGMGAIPSDDANLPTQLWIAARYLEAFAMLLAPLMVGRRPPIGWVVAGFAGVTLGLGAAIAVDVFPHCFTEGVGLTPFKIVSEYIICLLLLAAAVLLRRRRRQFDPWVYRLLMWAIGLTIASELAFTLYISAFGAANFLGHVLQVASFLLIYKAMIEVTLKRPYALLFRELAASRRQLSEAKEAAEAANDAKSQMLATVSHDLRTPMSAVIGLTELALEEDIPLGVRGHLETAKESAQGLLSLVNELLDLARIEAGKLVLEQTAFHLRTLIDETLQPLQIHAAEKRLRLEVDVGRDVPERVVGDPLRVKQVLTNLIGNGIKFTPAGSVGLTVRLHAATADQVAIEFIVHDTGIGIPAEDQARIFAPFAQARRSGLGHSGSGLGLSIASNLASLMGDGLRLKSEVGRGSAFSFVARFAPATGAVDAAAARDELPPRPARPLAILLAEDNRGNQRLVSHILHKRGHTVTVAGDGRRAVELAASKTFDLVLMDVEMPELDGFGATAAIRGLSDRRRASIPIVAMTAHALKGDDRRCLEAGMDAYLTKPIDAAQLCATVERLAR